MPSISSWARSLLTVPGGIFEYITALESLLWSSPSRCPISWTATDSKSIWSIAGLALHFSSASKWRRPPSGLEAWASVVPRQKDDHPHDHRCRMQSQYLLMQHQRPPGKWIEKNLTTFWKHLDRPQGVHINNLDAHPSQMCRSDHNWKVAILASHRRTYNASPCGTWCVLI